MNNVVLYLMGIASIAVIIAGAALCVTVIIYIMLKFWEMFSNVARNTIMYLKRKTDFETYMDDFARWENQKRINADKCRYCEYREKVLKSEDVENG